MQIVLISFQWSNQINIYKAIIIHSKLLSFDVFHSTILISIPTR